MEQIGSRKLSTATLPAATLSSSKLSITTLSSRDGERDRRSLSLFSPFDTAAECCRVLQRSAAEESALIVSPGNMHRRTCRDRRKLPPDDTAHPRLPPRAHTSAPHSALSTTIPAFSTQHLSTTAAPQHCDALLGITFSINHLATSTQYHQHPALSTTVPAFSTQPKVYHCTSIHRSLQQPPREH